MKKIGILTLNGYKNYGNRLQNYALQESVKSLGFLVDTVIVDLDATTGKKKNKKTTYLLKQIAKKVLGITKKKINDERTNRFIDFSDKYLSETKYKISEKNIPVHLSEYYKFVVGSDQVWNPFYINGSPLYFLNFAPKEKRISYAASFGISNIPSQFKEKFEKYLSEMNHISVREEQGASIVKEINGREAEVVLDPTMLLTKEEWRKVAVESKTKPNTPYLLTYFLGDISKTNMIKIKEIAKIRNLKIVNLASLKYRKYYTADPAEFLDFIDSADVFCTDSFHGVVFSILFETPFIVFERQGKLPSMNSRIDTLLSKFELESRLSRNIENYDDVFSIDYSHVKKILHEERINSISYLKMALKN